MQRPLPALLSCPSTGRNLKILGPYSCSNGSRDQPHMHTCRWLLCHRPHFIAVCNLPSLTTPLSHHAKLPGRTANSDWMHAVLHYSQILRICHLSSRSKRVKQEQQSYHAGSNKIRRKQPQYSTSNLKETGRVVCSAAAQTPASHQRDR